MSVPGRTWFFADYSQAESRVVAWKTPLPKLRQWYNEGRDVHSMVCNLIARVVQESKIQMPFRSAGRTELFKSLPWQKGDLILKSGGNLKNEAPEERDLTKRVVHGSNYDMGIDKLALVLGVDYQTAKILYGIYHALMPEIKSKYHKWCENELRHHKRIEMPEPVRFRKVFHSVNQYVSIDSDTLRSAYSCYPQCTVGALLVRAFNLAANCFRRRSGSRDDVWEPVEELKEIWSLWYGEENWDAFCKTVRSNDASPTAILWRGVDIRHNIHDAGGISAPKDKAVLNWLGRHWKIWAEVPIQISTDKEWGNLVIPTDFKVGPNMLDLVDFKLEKTA